MPSTTFAPILWLPSVNFKSSLERYHATYLRIQNRALKCRTETVVGKNVGHPTRWYIRHPSHDKPLGVGGGQFVSEYDLVAGYLRESVREDTLELALFCVVFPTDDGVAVARSVMLSLLRLPKTKGCSVRFCQERYHGFNNRQRMLCCIHVASNPGLPLQRSQTSRHRIQSRYSSITHVNCATMYLNIRALTPPGPK